MVRRVLELEDDLMLDVKVLRVLEAIVVDMEIDVAVAIGATKTTLGDEDWMINVAVIVPCVFGKASASPSHI